MNRRSFLRSSFAAGSAALLAKSGLGANAVTLQDRVPGAIAESETARFPRRNLVRGSSKEKPPMMECERLSFYLGASWARRRPENCQRVAGEKKLRYVARMCVAGVTHEPPRRMTCEDMNLPLYSPRAPGSGL